MKTITDLNSKWWWRLIKVLWILVSIIILCSISIGGYIQIITYSPKNMNLIHEEGEYAKEVTNHIVKMTDLIGNREELSIDDIVKISEKMGKVRKISGQTLLSIFSINPEINIGGYSVFPTNNGMHREDFYINGTNLEKEYYESLKNGNTFGFYYSELDGFNETIKYWKGYDKIYSDFKNGTSDAWSVFNYRSNQGGNIYTYEDYRGIKEWFLIVLFTIIGFLGIILFTYISRGIFYYIVLGNFFPKK